MQVNIITNTESVGLYQDACILKRLLEHNNISVRVINNFLPQPDYSGRGADLSIFLESLHNGHIYLNYARANWLVVNPEWYVPQQFDQYLPLISLIVCKTHHAYRVWSQRIGPSRVLYTGFESRDMLMEFNKTFSFLHVCGKSEAKGTDQVGLAWQHLAYPLTVVTRATTQPESQVTWKLRSFFDRIPNVRHLHNLTDVQLAEELSTHRFVIQPSLYEGYGHVIHEALSAKCVVLTTDAPPMSEFSGIAKRMLIPVARRNPRMMVEWNYCDAVRIRQVVIDAASMSEHVWEDMGEYARKCWERDRDSFRMLFTEAINRWEQWL